MTVTEPPQAAEPRTETLTVDGQRLRVAVREGDRTRPPLLLMNGIGCSLEVLEPFVRALPPQAGVIRFDAPGVGGSPTPDRPYRLGRICRLVTGMLAELGYARVDVLGVSWGGALAQQYAFQERRHCRRLVLVSTAPGAMLPPDPRLLREMATPRRLTDLEHALRVAPQIYGGKVRTDRSAVRVIHRARPHRRGYLFQQLALLGWTSIPVARWIRQPTLILTGDDDPIIRPLNARIMRAVIPNATLHVFHDGHLGLVTSADDLAPVIEAFLAEPQPA